MRAVKDSLAAPLEDEMGKNEKDGMGSPVGLLCSRSAQARKVLFRRAQGDINKPPSSEEKTSMLGGIIGGTFRV